MAKTRFYQKKNEPNAWYPDSVYFIESGNSRIRIVITNDQGFPYKADYYTIAEIDAILSGINLTWDAITGKPSTFPPSAHTHTEAEITDLNKYTQAEVDAIEAALTALINAKIGDAPSDGQQYVRINGGWAVVSIPPSSPTTTKGDLEVHNGTEIVRLPVGTDGGLLIANSGAPEGVSWLEPPTEAPYILLTLGAVQNVGGTDGTQHRFNWTVQEHIDTEFSHSISVNNTEITINTSGWYTIHHNFLGTQVGSGRTVQLGRLWVDNVIDSKFLPTTYGRGAAFGLYIGYQATYRRYFNAGEVVEIGVQVSDPDANYVTNASTSATYVMIVRDLDLIVGPKGDPGVNGSDGDITWEGVWSAGTYLENQAVENNGSSYVCVVPSTTEEPPHADWDLLAEKGDKGDPGVGGAPRQFSVSTYISSSTGNAGQWKTGARGDLRSMNSTQGTSLIGMSSNAISAIFAPPIDCKVIGVTMNTQATHNHGVISIGLLKARRPDGSNWYSSTLDNKAVILEDDINGGATTGIQTSYIDSWGDADLADDTISAGQLLLPAIKHSSSGSATLQATLTIIFEEV